MKHSFLLSVVVLSLFSFLSGHARDKYKYSDQQDTPQNELYLGQGIVTSSQLIGWAGVAPYNNYLDLPYKGPGATFVTYRHFFTRRFALSGSVGADFETGTISYGNPEYRINGTGYSGNAGRYNVAAYTVAVEGMLTYMRHESVMLYGCLGVGVTSVQYKYTIFDNAPHGSPVQVSSNPYNAQLTTVNLQLTGFGIRVGNKVAGFLEVGLGYKGLLNAGISARF